MYRILQKDYTFIATSDIDIWRKEQGWEFDDSFPYELKVGRNEESYQSSLRLAVESEVMIIGSAPEFYVKERMKERPDGITFRYSERIYKRGTWRAFSPRGQWGRRKTYYKYRKRKLFMLCASAYTSGDLRLQGSYLGKCYKWGYFPKTIHYNLDELMLKKSKKKTELLWCGRFIDWKHAEAAIILATMLRQEGIDFELNIIGSGEEDKIINNMIYDNYLESCVKLLGVMSPEQVRSRMEGANIYLCTSDFQEGWGAVINEAMNSGCAVVASHAAGSVPYLIKDGSNGLIYKNGDLNSLYKKVKYLITNKQQCDSLGRRAYETIINEWNAETAVKRLLLLIEDLKNMNSSDRFQSGPCSKAEIIRNNWYYEKNDYK